MKYKFKLLVIGPDNLLKGLINTIILVWFSQENYLKLMYWKKLVHLIFGVPCKDESFGQSNIEAMYCKVPTIILPIPVSWNYTQMIIYFTNGIDSKVFQNSK